MSTNEYGTNIDACRDIESYLNDTDDKDNEITDYGESEYVDDEVDEYENEFDIKNNLHEWAVSFNISLAALTTLLHILRLAGLDTQRCKDSTTDIRRKFQPEIIIILMSKMVF